MQPAVLLPLVRPPGRLDLQVLLQAQLAVDRGVRAAPAPVDQGRQRGRGQGLEDQVQGARGMRHGAHVGGDHHGRHRQPGRGREGQLGDVDRGAGQGQHPGGAGRDQRGRHHEVMHDDQRHDDRSVREHERAGEAAADDPDSEEHRPCGQGGQRGRQPGPGHGRGGRQRGGDDDGERDPEPEPDRVPAHELLQGAIRRPAGTAQGPYPVPARAGPPHRDLPHPSSCPPSSMRPGVTNCGANEGNTLQGG